MIHELRFTNFSRICAVMERAEGCRLPIGDTAECHSAVRPERIRWGANHSWREKFQHWFTPVSTDFYPFFLKNIKAGSHRGRKGRGVLKGKHHQIKAKQNESNEIKALFFKNYEVGWRIARHEWQAPSRRRGDATGSATPNDGRAIRI
ncbi:MAG TPA: hypothetical protein VG347_22195 [Verrucomicrobiae bacterium]|nr:hypothetical protein [Verrucomicrobiae bacterium]